MEMKEAEKIVIVKPIPSRPVFSRFRSFSEVLAGAIDASPCNAFSETAVAAIRPRTIRFKPAGDHDLVGMDSLEAEFSGSADSCSSDKVVKSDVTSSVIYKPIAKLVSKTAVSVLANLGRSNLSHQQEIYEVDGHAQQQSQGNNQLDLAKSYQNFASQSEIKGSGTLEKNSQADNNSLLLTNDWDRPSYDGYNWRKYGQKQVKGSEYPRSYYKCTQPGCPVKKKVERTLDGQIAEVVYKGVHNHPKPKPSKHTRLHGQGQGVTLDATSLETKNPLGSNQLNERNESPEGKSDNQNGIELSVHSTYSSRSTPSIDPITPGAFNVSVLTLDESFGLSGEEGSKGLEAEGDETKSKRRKKGNWSNKEGMQDPRTSVQNPADSEILGDGFRWRKYGQKVVKGNSYPRSYYRCTSLNCNVRKYVEQTAECPSNFVTTYEGRHNHDMPIRNAESATDKTSPKNKP